jgi:hypothetical protein
VALLKEPRLLDRILADVERCGVVGEETNTLVGYIAAVSRGLKGPLAVPQSSSAVGNHDTSWFLHFNGYSPRFLAMDAVRAFAGIPEVFAGYLNWLTERSSWMQST